MDASSTRPSAASLAGSGTKLFGAVCRLIPLKGKHKPLIHPPLAPAATQGLFLSPAWYPDRLMSVPRSFITPTAPIPPAR